MRVLVTHPYILDFDPREAALGRPYPPLGTLQAAAGLRADGHDVSFHDVMFARDTEHFGDLLDRQPWDLVAIVPDDHSVQIKQCLDRIRQAALSMVQAAHSRGITVIMSGPDASDHPEVFLGAGAAAVFRGEVVEALVEWARGDSAVPGVTGERGAGDGRRAPVSDLDALPDAAWDLCDLAPYAQMWRQRHGVWEINVWTARGCPYRCNWCAKPVWGRSYQVRSAERVAAEIRMIRQQHSPDRIWFTDDIFALRPKWLRAFRAALGADPLPYRCLSRVDLLRDAAYVQDLAASGCDQVWVGAESGSDRVLQAMDKDCTVDDIRRATRLLQENGVQIGFFLQLGYPGEGLDEVRATVSMIEQLRPDEIGVSVSKPMPGTAFYERVSASMRGENWDASMDNIPLFEAPFPQPFYAAAKEVLRSTHSAGRARKALRAFVAAPSQQAARKVAGALYHRVRLPVVRARMERLATPNPDAVPLTWA